jgi:hypothetical protein
MFVQYSFVQRRPSLVGAESRSIEMTPAIVMSAGVAFMAITSVLYLLSN